MFFLLLLDFRKKKTAVIQLLLYLSLAYKANKVFSRKGTLGVPDVFFAFNYFALITKRITLHKLISSTIVNETIVKIIVFLSF